MVHSCVSQCSDCTRGPHTVPCKKFKCLTLSLLQVCAGKSKGKQQMRGGRTAPPQRPEIPTPDVDEANAEFVLFARNTMVSTGHELFCAIEGVLHRAAQRLLLTCGMPVHGCG